MTHPYGSFDTTVHLPSGGGSGCTTTCLNGGSNRDGVAKLETAFDGATVVLFFLPGMQRFSVSCAIIGLGLGFAAAYAMH